MTTTYTDTAGKALIASDDVVRILKTIASGANLVAGTILGRVTKGARTAAGAAVAGNTSGSGAITAAPAATLAAKVGVYMAVCVEPATNLGKFLVFDPDGVCLGVATVGTEFVGGGLTFTIADATDFVSGDAFTITVTQAAPTNKLKAYAAANTDGSEVPVGVLLEDAAAASADVAAVVGFAGTYVDANMTGIDAAARLALEPKGIYFA
jgi:hypothetical protein